jgi:hypothetical protein
MKRITTCLTALALAAAAVVAIPAAASAHGGGGTVDKKGLRAVKRATAKYRDPAAAVAAGYVPTDLCASDPKLGGMGYHYVNPAHMGDGVIDPLRPEILVYVPTRHGRKLGAVEYLKPDADQDLKTDGDRPSVLGLPFEGPMPGHEPGMPIHYDKHLWLWKHNPAGRFEPFNPAVRCP